MELIEYLLGQIFRLVLILFLAWGVLFLVKLAYPNLSYSEFFKKHNIFAFDFLPAPRPYSGLFGDLKVASTSDIQGASYNTYIYDTDPNIVWDLYTATGTIHVRGGQVIGNGMYSSQNYNNNAQRYAYIRNLSLYDGQSVTYGQTIYGEANETMFRNGTFSVYILDAKGNPVSRADAVNLKTFSTPGFARFQANVQTRLPYGQCQMAFVSANQPLQVVIPVMCN